MVHKFGVPETDPQPQANANGQAGEERQEAVPPFYYMPRDFVPEGSVIQQEYELLNIACQIQLQKAVEAIKQVADKAKAEALEAIAAREAAETSRPYLEVTETQIFSPAGTSGGEGRLIFRRTTRAEGPAARPPPPPPPPPPPAPQPPQSPLYFPQEHPDFVVPEHLLQANEACYWSEEEFQATQQQYQWHHWEEPEPECDPVPRPPCVESPRTLKSDSSGSVIVIPDSPIPTPPPRSPTPPPPPPTPQPLCLKRSLPSSEPQAHCSSGPSQAKRKGYPQPTLHSDELPPLPFVSRTPPPAHSSHLLSSGINSPMPLLPVAPTPFVPVPRSMHHSFYVYPTAPTPERHKPSAPEVAVRQPTPTDTAVGPLRYGGKPFAFMMQQHQLQEDMASDDDDNTTPAPPKRSTIWGQNRSLNSSGKATHTKPNKSKNELADFVNK